MSPRPGVLEAFASEYEEFLAIEHGFSLQTEECRGCRWERPIDRMADGVCFGCRQRRDRLRQQAIEALDRSDNAVGRFERCVWASRAARLEAQAKSVAPQRRRYVAR